VGGSGRQSLSRISCFLANQKVFQIEVTKSYTMRTWLDNMRQLLMEAGTENKSICFLFVDTQIINEQMLEDINNILNSGDITNLYGDKELEEITSSCKQECMQKGL
jgi:dynein heavy chain, axonemal